MQYDHERQMRDLEQQFNQKLQQNNIELSHTLATTLGKTIKTHLHKPDTPTISSASSHSLNLINFETFIPKDKPQNIVHVLTKTTSVHHQNTFPTASMTDTLTELILATKEPKLYFQSFKLMSNYDNWKSMCILKTHKHPIHTSLTYINHNNQLQFSKKNDSRTIINTIHAYNGGTRSSCRQIEY
jgi:hypothetical protein